MKCGLLGRKLGHSYSPLIHSMLGDYPYPLYEKEPEELEDFFRTADWDGLNVTIPYKKDVLPFCDALSPLAKELGSVNTMVRRADGTVYGDNTDAHGFLDMVKSLPVDCAGKKALVLGSGGASVTVQAVLRQLGCEVVVISRRGEDNYENLSRHADAQVLVNTTPVGMYPNNGLAPVALSAFPKLEAVLDLIYNPIRTRLILDAQSRDIPCRSGLTMLVAQAVRAWELWTGQKSEPAVTEKVERAVAARMENVILIGMPGCGKSTLGRLLAEKLGRPFADADAVLTEKIGDIPTFLRTQGEEAFRRQETAVLAELGRQSGLVIATGGGCVTRPENYDLLHQNGKILWIRRALESLPTDGRPLSQQSGTAALYEVRKPLYEAFCDAVVDNDGTIDEALQRLPLSGELSAKLTEG